MIKYKKQINKKGIILIEALIALTVIIIIMTALVTALISALSNTTYSNQQTTATAYAQEGLDIARDQKNADFGEFENMVPGKKCLGKDETYIPGTCGDIDNIYERRIYIDNRGTDINGNLICESTDSIFVASIVSWSDSRCPSGNKCHNVKLSSCFVNLNYIDL